MYRAFVENVEDGKGRLSDQELHHLLKVRRAAEGDEVEALDGKGGVYLCTLKRDSDGWFVRVQKRRNEPRESALRLILAQALIKGDRFEWVIQKAVELGVSEIVPLITERSEIRLEPQRLANRLSRWRRIMVAAIKQCGRSVIPAVHSPLQLEECLMHFKDTPKLYLDGAGGLTLKTFLSSAPVTSGWMVLVGPEGGWGPRDLQSLRGHQVAGVCLGPRILRAETAPLAALSIFQYELGDLGGS